MPTDCFQNSRHPWQSWRDRWIKQFRGKPRPAFIPKNAPITSPRDQTPHEADVEMRRSEPSELLPFSVAEKELLLKHGEDIENIPLENRAAAWEKWASDEDVSGFSIINRCNIDRCQSGGHHPAQNWADFWMHHVRPIFLKERAQEIHRMTTFTISSHRQHSLSPKRTIAPTPSKTYPKIDVDTKHLRSRSLSCRTSSPMICHRSSILPMRTPPKKQKAYVSRSDNPGIDQEHDIRWEHDEGTISLPMLRTATPCLSTECGATSETSDSGSSQRKRATFDDHDLPSSSPPSSTLPLPLSNKRQRLYKSRTGPLEIASTPENSPTRRDLRKPFQFQSKDTGVVDVLEDDTSEDSSSKDSLTSDDDSRPHVRQASLTLSSPTRAVPETQTATTQAIFQDPTQDVDLDVPPPDEGWDDESLYDGVASVPNPNVQLVDFGPALTIPETQFTLPDTQGLLESRTHIPDFEIAEPDGGVVPSLPSPMPASRLSSPRDAANGPPTPDEVLAMNVWSDSKKALGYHGKDINKALEVTSTDDFELADYVLLYMDEKGEGQIPQDTPGVWTKSDDADLLSIDARRITKMHKKHGEKRCDARLNFNWHYGPNEE